MENYFGWLQTTMSVFPWSNTNLNRILLSHATQNVTATFAFMQKLSQAKNFQDVAKIQTEFMQMQMVAKRAAAAQIEADIDLVDTQRLRRQRSLDRIGQIINNGTGLSTFPIKRVN